MKRSNYLFILVLSLYSLTSWAQHLPKRLVLSVDGVSYYDIKRLQRGYNFFTSEGNYKYFKAFENFYPVSKNIAPWPSLSDISWSDIFQLVPMPGYQKFHFSNQKHEIVGIEGLTDMGTLADYERIQHWTLEGTFDHLMGYLFPKNAFTNEIDEIIEKFFKSTDQDTFYAYMVSTDDIQHMNGNVIEILDILNQKLIDLENKYTEITGEKLEIVMLSDHGNNKAQGGKRVLINEFLTAQGMNVKEKLENTYDVVIPTSGILNVVSVYVQNSDINITVNILKLLDGVDLITYIDPKSPNKIWITNPEKKLAYLEHKEMAGQSWYRYTLVHSDPLNNYGAIYEGLKSRNFADQEGYISNTHWFEYTKNTFYPSAIDRIYRGHHEITLNPSPIIVSLKRGYEHAGKLTKTMSQILTTGGTHGGLDHLSSNGIVMTNFIPTQDSSTDTVANQFAGFKHTKNFKLEELGTRPFTLNMLKKSKKENSLMLELAKYFSPKDALLELWGPNIMALMMDHLGLKLILTKKVIGNIYDGWVEVAQKEIQMCENSTVDLCTSESTVISLSQIFSQTLLPGSNYYLAITNEDGNEITGLYLDTDSRAKFIIY